MHMGDLTHRAYSPNASPVILRWGGETGVVASLDG
jgi:hypothetical protein